MGLAQERAKVSIRRAASADAPGILECLSAAFADYREAYTRSAFLDTVLTRETIQQRLAEMVVFVAINNCEQVVGTIGCQVVGRGEGHLRGMAVLPGWQGAGVASVLLQCAEAELHDKGCAHVTLDTTAPLARAVRFYEKNGYRRSGRITDFFGLPLFEFHKSLSP